MPAREVFWLRWLVAHALLQNSPRTLREASSGGELGIIGKRVSKRRGGGLKNEEASAFLESEFPEKIRDVVLCRAFCDIQLARAISLFVKCLKRSWSS